MRISTIECDPGYSHDAYLWTVIFNGEVQTTQTGRLIRTADDETGEIVFDKHLPDGTLISDVTEVGVVKIIRTPK